MLEERYGIAYVRMRSDVDASAMCLQDIAIRAQAAMWEILILLLLVPEYVHGSLKLLDVPLSCMLMFSLLLWQSSQFWYSGLSSSSSDKVSSDLWGAMDCMLCGMIVAVVQKKGCMMCDLCVS